MSNYWITFQMSAVCTMISLWLSDRTCQFLPLLYYALLHLLCFILSDAHTRHNYSFLCKQKYYLQYPTVLDLICVPKVLLPLMKLQLFFFFFKFCSVSLLSLPSDSCLNTWALKKDLSTDKTMEMLRIIAIL